MRNCKEEFVKHVGNSELLCASLQHGRTYDDSKEFYFLPEGFTETERDRFLQAIDFEYDSGFGSQELYGFIWYKDGTWSSRGEYDGSEWWEYHTCPAIPVEPIIFN